jgi:hypothetical protein
LGITAEVYSPNSACSRTLPTSTAGFPTFFQNMNGQYVMGKGLFVCGRNPVVGLFECYNLPPDGASWTKIIDPPLPFFDSQVITSFIYDNKMWFVSDSYPRVFDFVATPPTFQNFWQSADNRPINTLHPTRGGGCAVAVGDYVYLFGGAATVAIQRFLLKPTSTGVPRQWEYLTDLPGPTLSACAPLPTDRNKIMVAMYLSSTMVNDAIIYDTQHKTLTPVASSLDLTGASLLELCRNSIFYAFPIGTGAKIYSPSATNTIWNPFLFGKPQLSTTYYLPIVVKVPFDFGQNFTSPINCNGC